MKNVTKRLLTTLVVFALVFTCFPAFTGSLEADAATKPGKVTKLEVSCSTAKATITWKKLAKNVNGYTIYRNGKAIKSVGKKVNKYTDKTIKKNKSYTYYIKAYRIIKQKQWYNKKSGKWQTKKPARKYRGKSRIVSVKLYGNASPKKTIKIPTESSFKANVKAEDGFIKISWTRCSGASKYIVFRNGEAIEAVTNLYYEDKGVVAGKSYKYKLQAINSKEVVLEELTFKEITAKSNNNFRAEATVAGDNVTLTWSDFETADCYKVYRDGTEIYSGNDNSYTDDTVDYENNASYTYQVVKHKDGSEIGSVTILCPSPIATNQ